MGDQLGKIIYKKKLVKVKDFTNFNSYFISFLKKKKKK